MSKTVWNLIVNVLLYLLGCVLVSTGAILYFLLVPGSRGGHGLSLLGMSRHEWGDIHFYLACGITALTIIHLLLNWPWIKAVVKRYVSSKDKQLGTGGTLSIALLLFLGVGLVAAPFVIGVERGNSHGDHGYGGDHHGGAEHHRGGEHGKHDPANASTHPGTKDKLKANPAGTATAKKGNTDGHQGHGGGHGGGRTGAFFLRGRSTLQEAAQAVGMTAQQLATTLGLPKDTPADARFGHIGQELGLTMHEIRARLAQLGQQAPEKE